MYEYRATILRHLDADTSWVSIDLGFDCAIKLTIRWSGINAPEKNTTDGEAALNFVRMMLPEQSRCTLRTIKDKREKFGRYLGEFILNDGTNLNHVLLQEGFAEPYFVSKEAD